MVTLASTSVIPAISPGTSRRAGLRRYCLTLKMAFSIALQVGRVRRPPQDRAPGRGQQLVDPPVVVGGQFVQHQHLPGPPGRDQPVPDEGDEPDRRGPAVVRVVGDDPAAAAAADAQGGHGANGLVVAGRGRRGHPLAGRGPAVGPPHGRVRAELVGEDQVGGLVVGERVEPAGPAGDDVGPVPLGRVRRLFFAAAPAAPGSGRRSPGTPACRSPRPPRPAWRRAGPRSGRGWPARRRHRTPAGRRGGRGSSVPPAERRACGRTTGCTRTARPRRPGRRRRRTPQATGRRTSIENAMPVAFRNGGSVPGSVKKRDGQAQPALSGTGRNACTTKRRFQTRDAGSEVRRRADVCCT